MKKDTTKKPFFARLLEDQELDAVSGGGTLKYPSDSDERGGIGDTTNVVTPPSNSTKKYPSDSDEAL